MKAYGTVAFVNNIILTTEYKFWTMHQSLDSEGTSRLDAQFDEKCTNSDSSAKFMEACQNIQGDVRIKLYKEIPDGNRGGSKHHMQHFLRLPEKDASSPASNPGTIPQQSGGNMEMMFQMMSQNNALQLEILKMQLEHKYEKESKLPTKIEQEAHEMRKEMMGMVKMGIQAYFNEKYGNINRPVNGTADINTNPMSMEEAQKRVNIIKESVKILNKDNAEFYLQIEKLAKLKKAQPEQFNNLVNMLMNFPI